MEDPDLRGLSRHGRLDDLDEFSVDDIIVLRPAGLLDEGRLGGDL